MSILIKGMEMPKNCEECRLESFCSLWIDARKICGEDFTDAKSRVKATIRHPDCPLIEINIPIVTEKPKNDGQYERMMERAKRCGKGVKFEHQWIFADLDTIIDCYSEPPKEET